MPDMWLRNLTKRTVVPVMHRTGLLKQLDRRSANCAVLALNYHCVEPTIFESHARYLTERAEVIDPGDLEKQVLTGNAPGRQRVVLTFDDGYASFVHRIHPILEQYGLPALWFVPTDYIGSTKGFWFDRVRLAVVCSKVRELRLEDKVWELPRRSHGRGLVANQVTLHLKTLVPDSLESEIESVIRQMGEPPDHLLEARRIATEEEIRLVDGKGVYVESHSRTHPNLLALDEETLDNELSGSKNELEALLGRTVEHFSYPSGGYNDQVISRLEAAGYRWAWNTDPGFIQVADLPYCIPRVVIDDHASDAVLAAKMSPWMHRTGTVH